MSTIKVRPRPGVILAGIPAAGTAVERTLAEEWLAAGLVVRAKDTPHAMGGPVEPTGPGSPFLVGESGPEHIQPVSPAEEK
jgi:hypothetical protein